MIKVTTRSKYTHKRNKLTKEQKKNLMKYQSEKKKNRMEVSKERE